MFNTEAQTESICVKSGTKTSLNMTKHIAGCGKCPCELQVLTSYCLIPREMPLRCHITARVVLVT